MRPERRRATEIKKEVLEAIAETSPRKLKIDEIKMGSTLDRYGIRAQKALRQNLAEEFPELQVFELEFNPRTRVKTLTRRVEAIHRRAAGSDYVWFTCKHCNPVGFGLCPRDDCKDPGEPTQRPCRPW